MGFYDLSKEERKKIFHEINDVIMVSIMNLDMVNDNIGTVQEGILKYATNRDTYIRKNVSRAIGRIYGVNEHFRGNIMLVLDIMLNNSDEKVRQTSVYALGEIGKKDFGIVLKAFEKV